MRAGSKKVFCPSCLRFSQSFAIGPGGRRARCPRCSSLERHRMLIMLLRGHEDLFAAPSRTLDLAPNKAISRYLAPRLGARYVTADKFMDSEISVKADLTRLGFASGSFEVIICYHVLEHIVEDDLAIAELVRVLKPDGVVFVQVPRRIGSPTDEDPSVVTAEERTLRFGQDDHVRVYGDDFEERLRRGGLEPQTLRPAMALPEQDLERFGLARDEEVWICRRAGSAPVVEWKPPHFEVPNMYERAVMSSRRFAGRVVRKLGLRRQ